MARKNKDASVAKVVELSAASSKSLEDAVESGIARANKTLKGITGAWVQDMKVDVVNGKITRYRVNMKVTFVLNG